MGLCSLQRRCPVLPQLLLLGLVIGSNNAALALALGALGQDRRRWRIVLLFGFFEAMVPLVGMWLGHELAARLTRDMAWAAPAALVVLGLWSLLEALRGGGRDSRLAARMTTWSGLLVLALTLSVDNLVVGIGLGLERREAPLRIAATIGAFSMAFMWGGLRLGDKARRHWERYARVAAGVLLVAVGIALGLGWP
jgi:putative Mn2+ efflux pump MntP